MWSGWIQGEHKTLIFLFPELAPHYLTDVVTASLATPGSPFVVPTTKHSRPKCVCPSRVLVVSSCRVDDVFGPRDARGGAGTFVEVADDERYWTPPIYSSMMERLSLYEVLLDALITRRIGPNRPEASPGFCRVPRQTTRIF